ncbi:zinc finger BED domain-containing protein RICESLEEPER 2-like [Vicia villosa]|uniref:zinc finger BED domain-containing protein RICESLEEPER 2-like n=1 Tax=Vicia villosa TaxID=3911 RepID=UPI00273BB8DF|nr:zinc finger BED domain-containing protein RICESLEEPER 2-like [Vicia villosa]
MDNKGKKGKSKQRDHDDDDRVTTATSDDLVILCDHESGNLVSDESMWIIDNGNILHVTPRNDFFTSYISGDFGVWNMGNDGVSIIGVGDVYLQSNMAWLVKSFSGAVYFVTFIDDCSMKLWVYVLKTKDQVLENFQEFHALKYHNIAHEMTPPKTPQLNGLAERMNRTLIEKIDKMSSSIEVNEGNEHVQVDLPVEENEKDTTQAKEVQKKRKRPKTSEVWQDFDEVEVAEGVMKAICKYCKLKYSTGGKGSSTSHLKRHSENCMHKKMHQTVEKKQPVIPFKPSNSANPFMSSGVRYSNEKMREVIATAIMIHEYPFSIVEDDVWMWAFQYANSDFHKVTRKTIRSDCLALYEREKKILKNFLESVSKISLTTDMWKSTHQVAEYMVITGHFIDAGWNLQKRVLSFVKVPAPRRGIDVADAIYKCLKNWGIENKVFSVSVDNASYNDSCLRCLKENLSLSSKLFLGGSLFHVRCCAHILNLLVQDGLSKIKSIIYNIRESVKYVNFNDARLKAFCDVVEQKGLKDKTSYKEREPHYDFAPSLEEWNKVEKVCKLLEVFNLATHVISGSEYPTANLYLAEVWRVKQVIDNAIEDEDLFMREMAGPMKLKFDKYWGECNMLMAIASVLDPRCKFHMVNICFPKIYTSKEVSDENIKKFKTSLEEIFDEYVSLNLEESSSVLNSESNNSSSSQVNKKIVTGFDQIMSILREKEAVPPIQSELQSYLGEGIYIPNDNNAFSALDWWRNNSLKYKILSKMAADVLAIPISTVASESTFSAGGRVIDEYRSKLNEESIEALICGGDWFRHKYNIKKKLKVDEKSIQITLKI